jgi:hypothetical protein
MANQFLNVNWISMEVLRNLINSLVVAEYFNMSYDKDFKKEFAVGATVQVKFPQQFIIRDGLGYNPQGIQRLSTTVTLDLPFGIDFEFDDYERAVKAERSEQEIREQYLEPAGQQLAQELDSRAAKFAYQNASNVVGSLGTDPNSVATYHAARRRLLEKACPPGKKAMCISSSMMASLGSNLTNIFNPRDEISQLFKEGYLGELAGFEFYESQSLYAHTAGTWAAAVTVNGANQSGNILNVSGTNGDTFKKGDKISIANVNAVNPRTRRIAGPAQPQQFTIQNDAVVAGGTAALTILPAIVGPGSQYQNVDALPANGAALTLWPGTAAPNGKVGTVGLALSKYAFALVGGKLYTPKAVEQATQAQDKQTGLAVRFVKAWDPVRSMNIHRFDQLIGFGNLYQDNGAVCVVGA